MSKIERIFDYIESVEIDYHSFQNSNRLKYEVDDDDNTNIEIDYSKCLEFNFNSDFYDENGCECFINVYDTKNYLSNIKCYDYYIVRIEIEYRYNFEYVIKSEHMEKLLELITDKGV